MQRANFRYSNLSFLVLDLDHRVWVSERSDFSFAVYFWEMEICRQMFSRSSLYLHSQIKTYSTCANLIDTERSQIYDKVALDESGKMFAFFFFFNILFFLLCLLVYGRLQQTQRQIMKSLYTGQNMICDLSQAGKMTGKE